MNLEPCIRVIGLGHLLQPPLTLLLAKRLRLRQSFETLPAVSYRVAENMAFAAVALPTSLGVFMAMNAHDALELGPTWSLGLGIAAFWCWRLERQLRILGPLLRERDPLWHPLLTLIFVVQGPLLGSLLLARRFGGVS